MEEREQVGVDTLTQDERDSQVGELPAKRDPSLSTVTSQEIQGRRLVLAATSPTYTPPPIGDLPSSLRMVVADLTQIFSLPPDPACGDQWRGVNYVHTPVAELERLEERRRELETEIPNRRAGYSIGWTRGLSLPALAEPGLLHSPGPIVRRPQPLAFSLPRARLRPQTLTEAPPAYTERAVTPSDHMRPQVTGQGHQKSGVRAWGTRQKPLPWALPPPPNYTALGGLLSRAVHTSGEDPTGREGDEVG